jgi:hypothetical protein
MSAHRYESAAEALKDLEDTYNYWSGKITESSTAFALGLIAANWAVYGSKGLKELLCPRLSVFCALLLLLTGLLIAQAMTSEHDLLHQKAENDPASWEAQYVQAKTNKDDPWPYSKKVERLGLWGRRLKVWLPIAGAVFFLISFV